MDYEKTKKLALGGDKTAVSDLISWFEEVREASKNVLPWMEKAVELDVWKSCVLPCGGENAYNRLRVALIAPPPEKRKEKGGTK